MPNFPTEALVDCWGSENGAVARTCESLPAGCLHFTSVDVSFQQGHIFPKGHIDLLLLRVR